MQSIHIHSVSSPDVRQGINVVIILGKNHTSDYVIALDLNQRCYSCVLPSKCSYYAS